MEDCDGGFSIRAITKLEDNVPADDGIPCSPSGNLPSGIYMHSSQRFERLEQAVSNLIELCELDKLEDLAPMMDKHLLEVLHNLSGLQASFKRDLAPNGQEEG